MARLYEPFLVMLKSQGNDGYPDTIAGRYGSWVEAVRVMDSRNEYAGGPVYYISKAEV